MIFGTLFLADGLLQSVSAIVVRYSRWRIVLALAIVEILLAVFFFEPYPTHYVGTAPYAIGLGLAFGGWNMLWIAFRVRRMESLPPENEKALTLSDDVIADPTLAEKSATDKGCRGRGARTEADSPFEWDGPPAADEKALTVHVWTPVGSARAQANRRLIVDRYIAAVDANGVISTGHAALESPEGIYISLYPGVGNRSFAGRVRAHPARDSREQRAGHLPAGLRDGIEGVVRIHDPRAHSQLPAGSAAGVLGQISAGSRPTT